MNGDENGHPIRVLVAEDSATVRHQLVQLLNATPGLTVVGEACDGSEALRLVHSLRPDVVSMDVRMPVLDGLEATRRIMAAVPTPVVIVSALVQREIDLSFQALEAGALAVVEKPPSPGDSHYTACQRKLVRTLAAMARVSLVHRSGDQTDARADMDDLEPDARPHPEVVVVGASAGGPTALNVLLAALPEALPVPVVIVQHIAAEFVAELARWLDKRARLRVRVAEHDDLLIPGTVYLAPGGVHLEIVRHNRALRVALDDDTRGYVYQPSVDVLFASAARVCQASAVGLILSGMGSDGAAGLLAMRQAGAYTFAQNAATATVYGMPNAAIECGAVESVLPLAALSPAILKLV